MCSRLATTALALLAGTPSSWLSELEVGGPAGLWNITRLLGLVSVISVNSRGWL